MTDIQLQTLLVAQLQAAMTKAGWSFPVIQGDQPTQQGIPASGFVEYQMLMDNPRGWPGVALAYNSTEGEFDETSQQWTETTFQISAQVIQDPTNLTLPTPRDVMFFTRQFMLSQNVLNVFYGQTPSVGVLNVTQVRNVVFTDDRGQNEYHPSFDITFTHYRNYVDQVPATNVIQGAVITNVTNNGLVPI